MTTNVVLGLKSYLATRRLLDSHCVSGEWGPPCETALGIRRMLEEDGSALVRITGSSSREVETLMRGLEEGSETLGFPRRFWIREQ